jgi:hypothetical protein
MKTMMHLALATAAGAMMAAEGLASALDTNRVTYIVHKEGEPGTLELAPSGRILTEQFDRPEWAGTAVLALLGQRNEFYQQRLGAELAEPLVSTNVINFLDLGFVALDENGDEIEMTADDEFRQNVLAAALGVDRETGDIAGSITDHYIDRDNAGYTLEDIASKQDIDKVFGNGEQQQAASGQ